MNIHLPTVQPPYRPGRLSRSRWPGLLVAALLLIAAALVAGCWSAPRESVVVYTALDPEFSEPILGRFTEETDIEVLAKFDVESTKTVGLANALLAEAGRPRADVFWNNEILNTLRLRDAGLLEPYVSPVGQQYPPQYRGDDNTWYGFAARARVLIVNASLPEQDRPRSIHDLTDPRWKGRAGIAKPLFGTTATHAACLFAVWGDDQAEEFFRAVKANDVRILSGNKQVAQAVASGQLLFGLTDTDDALVEQEQGHPVAIVYPDSQPDQLGTLFIPNTIAILKNAPHPEAARKLVDHVLSPETEALLARGPSGQIPLHPETKAEARVETPRSVKAMEVDFEAAAKKWDRAAAFLRKEFGFE